MIERHVALVGFMGCGKSTIGALVARRLKLRFVDLDALIIEKHGPIEEIFARDGERGFREAEHAVLKDVLATPAAMISTGGGVLTYEPSRVLLADVLTIYLEVSMPGIVRRLRRSATVRPLMGPAPTVETVSALFKARSHLYAASSHRVNAEREVGSVVASVLRLLKK